MISLILGLAVLGCVLQGVFILVEHKEKYVPAVILKGLASVFFCIIGYYAFNYAGVDFEAGVKATDLVDAMLELFPLDDFIATYSDAYVYLTRVRSSEEFFPD